VQRLIADVTEFMSLHEGDILLVGVPEDPPLLHAGDKVSIEIEGVGRVTNRLVREGVAR
jgi:5-oxopent-3-ene-1,2,5-tricarboxylate decarboxylase/2-hydroxyhepta-2,4-diene-1,7-dioate isomerase